MRPGFKRYELKARYDVSEIHEDQWHTFGDQKRAQLIRQTVQQLQTPSRWLLNAGAGVHALNLPGWNEVSADIFASPLAERRLGVCARLSALPFPSAQFDVVVCVGEVLGYCDPAQAIAELARVLAPGGTLLCDFGNTRSARYWLTSIYGRAAELTVVDYNGSPERIWIYSLSYIRSILEHYGFRILDVEGIYRCAPFFQRLGASPEASLRPERWLSWAHLPLTFSDVMFIVAKQVSALK